MKLEKNDFLLQQFYCLHKNMGENYDIVFFPLQILFNKLYYYYFEKLPKLPKVLSACVDETAQN